MPIRVFSPDQLDLLLAHPSLDLLLPRDGPMPYVTPIVNRLLRLTTKTKPAPL
jgi:hypothetical protein